MTILECQIFGEAWLNGTASISPDDDVTNNIFMPKVGGGDKINIFEYSYAHQGYV